MSSLWTENIQNAGSRLWKRTSGHRFDHWRRYGGCFVRLFFYNQAGVDYCLLERDRICQA